MATGPSRGRIVFGCNVLVQTLNPIDLVLGVTWSSESSQIWTMSRSRGQSKAATWSMATCAHHVTSRHFQQTKRQLQGSIQRSQLHSTDLKRMPLSLNKVLKQGMRC